MSVGRLSHSRKLFGAVLAAGFLSMGALLVMPSTTKQGVDFAVSTYRIPLYVKALNFIDRDCQYRVLANQVTHGLESDQERIRALYDWTRAHIRATPPGLPVIDDHILHTMIRGYGQDDQMADVFTTLATYAGLPAFWRIVKIPGGRLILSFARVDNRWMMCDVANGLIFADSEGELVDVHEWVGHPERVRTVAGDLAPYGIPYGQYVAALEPFRVPGIFRVHKQMLWPRLVFEIRRRLGVQFEDEPWEHPATP